MHTGAPHYVALSVVTGMGSIVPEIEALALVPDQGFLLYETSDRSVRISDGQQAQERQS